MGSLAASGHVLFPFSVTNNDITGSKVVVLRHHKGAIVHRSEPVVPNLRKPGQSERDDDLAPFVFTGKWRGLRASPHVYLQQGFTLTKFR